MSSELGLLGVVCVQGRFKIHPVDVLTSSDGCGIQKNVLQGQRTDM